MEHLRTYQSSVLDLELTKKAEWIYCVISSLLNEVLKVTDQSVHENSQRSVEEVGHGQRKWVVGLSLGWGHG